MCMLIRFEPLRAGAALEKLAPTKIKGPAGRPKIHVKRIELSGGKAKGSCGSTFTLDAAPGNLRQYLEKLAPLAAVISGPDGKSLLRPPREHTCASEHWEAMAGPEALLPEEYLRLPLEDLRLIVQKDLVALADSKLDPRDRCRLAHYLGNFSSTERGEQLYPKMGAYKDFFGIVQEFRKLYGACKSVRRPCVAGFAMLAINNMLKQEMQKRCDWFNDDSRRGKGPSGSAPKELSVIATYMLGSNPAVDPHRLLCVWSLLKAVTAEVEKSRGALRTLAYNLELLTIMELANMSLGESGVVSLLTVVREESVEVAKIQVLKAASLLLRYSRSRIDVCTAAQALGLFEVAKNSDLFARGREGWRLFLRGGGVTPLARALPLLGTSEEDATDRLSILSFLTDLGPPHSHAELILPALDSLIRWAGAEGAQFEHERNFSMLALGRVVRGGDANDVAFMRELGLFSALIRRLRDYLGRLSDDPTATEVSWCGSQPGNDLLTVALEMLRAFVCLSPGAAQQCLREARDMVDMTASLLPRAAVATEPVRSSMTELVCAVLCGLVEQDTVVIRQMRETPNAMLALRQLLFCIKRARVLLLLMRLVILCLLVEPDLQDFKDIYDRGAVLPELEALKREVPSISSSHKASSSEQAEVRASLEAAIQYLICAVVIREKRVDLDPVHCAYRCGGAEGLFAYLKGVDVAELIAGQALPPTAPPLIAAGAESTCSNGPPFEYTCTSAMEAGVVKELPLPGALDEKLLDGLKGDEANVCRACKKGPDEGAQLLRCSRCKCARYCSRECQLAHWKAGHRKECVACASHKQ